MPKKAESTSLRYVGPDPGQVGGVPLPEGWPAASHDEPDAELRAAKLAFEHPAHGRMYAEEAARGDGD